MSLFSRRLSTPQLKASKRRDEAIGTVLRSSAARPSPELDQAESSAFNQSADGGRSADEELGARIDVASKNLAIEAALASMQTLRVFVTERGVVYHVEDARRRRHLEQLLNVVQKELGQAIAKPVSLMEYSKLRSQFGRPQETSVSHNDLVEMILNDAIDRKSSDVYIAIHTDRTLIHFRTHGVRYLHAEISPDDGLKMARSLWSLSPDGQHEEDKPTDTAFKFRDYRVRANSMPEVRGNSIVLRFRDPGFIPPLTELGYSVRQQRQIDDLQWSAGGLAVISGETNSGKSTTLTSMMASLPESEMIIEIADPIEVEFGHVTHIEFDHYAEDAEQRFRDLLAALVRQNPDTLFIGEIRDLQSATAGIDMSLQGKRVWGTVHSHSCVTTISRLEHLGIDVNLLAQPGFLNGVINQSLVPTVCANCRMDKLRDDVLTSRLRHKFQSDEIRFRNPDGCSQCAYGFSGQTVVAEVMSFSRAAAHESRQFIRDHDLARLAACMREDGMTSKAAHALAKIHDGLLDPIQTEGVIGRIGSADSIPDEIFSQARSKPTRSTDSVRH